MKFLKGIQQVYQLVKNRLIDTYDSYQTYQNEYISSEAALKKMVCRGFLGPPGLRKDQVPPENFSTYELNWHFLKVNRDSKYGE